MLYLIYCLLRDLVKWEVKMSDLFQFLYMDLFLGLMYAMVTGIKSRSAKTVLTSCVGIIILNFVIVAALNYASEKDAKAMQNFVYLLFSSFLLSIPGVRVTRYYKHAKAMEQLTGISLQP
ncbi:hypothetical protein HDE_14223 [Halotydeus destructor]|nr:hypothetical protein HDE_14223 [Halotydeus destructor]